MGFQGFLGLERYILGMDYLLGGFDPFAALRKAQQEQLRAMLATRRKYAQTALAGGANKGTHANFIPVDTVNLGSTLPELGLMPNPLRSGNSLHEIPRLDDPQYFQKQNAFYDDILRQAMAVKQLEAIAGIGGSKKGTKSANSGDLNVVAGNRTDGVKAKKVTVHELRNWPSRQHNENIAGYNSHDSKFENKKVGTTYQVRVEWEDGSSTVRDVTMEKPGQTVYIDTAY